jgi:hypothetical protein
MENRGDDERRSPRWARILERAESLRRPAGGRAGRPGATRELDSLHARVDHLEAAFEGLQDAVYRDAQRHEHELAELRRAMLPENMARTLSVDARRRGL